MDSPEMKAEWRCVWMDVGEPSVRFKKKYLDMFVLN